KSRYLVNNGCITSTDELENKDEGIAIYPNPVHNQFYLEIARAYGPPEISLSDISGRNIAYTIHEVTDGKKYRISVSPNIPSGIYLLRVRNERNAVVKSVVIR